MKPKTALRWLVLLLASCVAPVQAQFDFSEGETVALRTYPVSVGDGGEMPRPQAMVDGRPEGLVALPRFAIDDDAPGASLLPALAAYQKRFPASFLAMVSGLVENRFLELEIDKRCSTDIVRLHFTHVPNAAVPDLERYGLVAISQVMVDAARSADLYREIEWLKRLYNNGLIEDREQNQYEIRALTFERVKLALYYLPRMVAAGDETPTLAAKLAFRDAMRGGGARSGRLVIGPLELDILARQDVRKKPASSQCDT